MRQKIKCDTPGCGKAIPKGGEGHPEICPQCLRKEAANPRRWTQKIDVQIDSPSPYSGQVVARIPAASYERRYHGPSRVMTAREAIATTLREIAKTVEEASAHQGEVSSNDEIITITFSIKKK
jgi:hypothetical protein